MHNRWMGAITALAMLGACWPALADSNWVESSKLSADEVGQLCGRSQGLTTLAKSQIVASGDSEWRRLSRVQLAVEGFAMGTGPLDTAKCYVIARAGNPPDAVQRRAFEVRDFASNPASVRVMVVGWDTRLAE